MATTKLELAGAVCLLGVSIFGPTRVLVDAQQAAAPAAAPAATPSAPTLTGQLTFAAAGDSILLRPISVYEKDPAFAGLLSLMRNATVAFTNFEMSVFDTQKFTPTPQAEYGGLWVHGTPRSAEDLRWLGIDMVSRANNHTTDYGVEGMLETDQVLDQLGLVHAGSGKTLGQARAPAYFQTSIGRVAMISTASSHSPMGRAANPRPDIKGRPGLSPLRWSTVVYLDGPSYSSLKNAITAMNLVPPPQPFTDEEMTVFGTRVKRGDANRRELVANEHDVQDIIAQVKSARRQADLVFVTIHAHEPGNESERPADFLPGFARACIDAGADMFITHGPHQLRGIELYKQRPIFYSLGNFFFQYQTLEPQAADVYESFGLDPFKSTIGDLYDATKGRSLAFAEDVWWESAVALVTWDRGGLKAIELHPIDLGASLPRPQKGTPRIARAGGARKIVERLSRLSSPFGTRIRFASDIGIVEVTPAPPTEAPPVSGRR
jgi:poly-gamma-glutamate capsule biosynthesis protein CapA/YwtB (metallophosphatase superfamily)